ncbi:hypothetical protein Syun_009179 [Stephania yunnanensis]|uniref:Uncharacterized protein n=1 Tax=Stephania yunnanensis TaxID=152371 RepID=A0AAP0KGN6_9MAGN
MTTRVLNVKIVGDLKVKKKVVVQGNVIDENEKVSTVEFFITRIHEFDIVNDLIPVRPFQIEKEFQLPVKAIGYYLVAKYITTAVAGKFGIPVYTVSNDLVQNDSRDKIIQEVEIHVLLVTKVYNAEKEACGTLAYRILAYTANNHGVMLNDGISAIVKFGDFLASRACVALASLRNTEGIVTAPILFAMEEFPQLRTVVDRSFDDPVNVDLLSVGDQGCLTNAFSKGEQLWNDVQMIHGRKPIELNE